MAYHNSKGGTPLRNDLVPLVGQVGNANERRGIGGGHRGGGFRGVPGFYGDNREEILQDARARNQLTSTGRCRWRCRVGMEVAVRPRREVWERSRSSGADGRNFLGPLGAKWDGTGAGSCQSHPCQASGEPEVGEGRPLSPVGF